jgi:hypothetical protein
MKQNALNIRLFSSYSEEFLFSLLLIENMALLLAHNVVENCDEILKILYYQ